MGIDEPQRRRALATIAAVMALPAMAHTDKPHEKTGPVRQEQKDWGIAAEPQAATRTVIVRMSDNMRFTPDVIAVKLGETVRFVFTNEGAVTHDAVIGDEAVQEEHEDEMRSAGTAADRTRRCMSRSRESRSIASRSAWRGSQRWPQVPSATTSPSSSCPAPVSAYSGPCSPSSAPGAWAAALLM